MRTHTWLLTLTLVGCGTSFTSRPGPGAESEAGKASTTGSGAGTLTAGIWDDALNFTLFTTFRDTQQNPLVDFTPDEQAAVSATRTRATALDVAVVIDTTGSMGDEIAYLQTELRAVAGAASTTTPGLTQRWALVHYRDQGDSYLVRHVDFGGQFQTELAGLHAGGGGDFPEAPERALEQVAQLSWSTDAAVAKVVLWVADAPPHDRDAARFSSAVRALQAKGVHVYPVASSGIDVRTEYAMRATAQLTLGRYVFLTDDSGVGDTHLEPTVPCYVVTKLNHALERVLASELAGARVEVDPARVIRTVGSPVDGHCTLSAGTVAQLF